MITHLTGGASGAPPDAQLDTPAQLKLQQPIRKSACVGVKDVSQVKSLVVSFKLIKSAKISFYFN